MRAIEKDRSRRYETASALAKDIQRYLRHEPVEAREPSSLYRLGKFVRRHRTQVAAAAVVTLAFLLFLVFSAVLVVVALGTRNGAAQSR